MREEIGYRNASHINLKMTGVVENSRMRRDRKHNDAMSVPEFFFFIFTGDSLKRVVGKLDIKSEANS